MQIMSLYTNVTLPLKWRIKLKKKSQKPSRKLEWSLLLKRSQVATKKKKQRRTKGSLEYIDGCSSGLFLNSHRNFGAHRVFVDSQGS